LRSLGRTATGLVCKWLRHFIANAPLRGTPLNEVLCGWELSSMNWKFYSEYYEDIPLPPDYTFPQAFNYLNNEGNSFYILEKQQGYLQLAGSKDACTVELRESHVDGTFRHGVFYNEAGSDEVVEIKMTHGSVRRKAKHLFGFLKAAAIFRSYYEGTAWPSGVKLEDISDEFNEPA
jgi:hypothetical protein